MGTRLIDEYMSKSGLDACKDIKEAAESIAKVGFKMFLGVTANVINMLEITPQTPIPSLDQPQQQQQASSTKQIQFSLVFEENPLNDFVELPDLYKTKGLFYSNLLPGVIRGALEMVQMKVECQYVKCPLRGDDVSEIRVKLIEYLKETVPDDDD